MAERRIHPQKRDSHAKSPSGLSCILKVINNVFMEIWIPMNIYLALWAHQNRHLEQQCLSPMHCRLIPFPETKWQDNISFTNEREKGNNTTN